MSTLAIEKVAKTQSRIFARAICHYRQDSAWGWRERWLIKSVSILMRGLGRIVMKLLLAQQLLIRFDNPLKTNISPARYKEIRDIAEG